MARPLRLQVPAGIFHVTARGNGRADIYLDDRDRTTFLADLRTTVERQDWACLAYCLMPNHFHLLVRTSRPNLSAGMQRLNGVYAQRFNRRHDRVGHVFQGRFHAALVQRETHLHETLRYVALNPVRAGFCAAPSDWAWSSHRAVLGRAAPGVVAVDQVRALFGGAEAYEAFVLDHREGALRDPAPSVYGDRAFARTVLPDQSPGPEIPVRCWDEGRPSLAEIFAAADLDRAIHIAHRCHDHRLTAIAAHLDCHVSTVSRRLQRFEALRCADARSDPAG